MKLATPVHSCTLHSSTGHSAGHGFIIPRLICCVSSTTCVAGCAGNWASYNYGPCDWSQENWAWQVDSLHNYQALVRPEILVHQTEDLSLACRSQNPCVHLSPNFEFCHVYLAPNATEDVLAHEKRHCLGWVHGRERPMTWKPHPRLAAFDYRTPPPDERSVPPPQSIPNDQCDRAIL